MSEWSGASGTVVINNGEHFSLKKYTNSFYDEVSIDVAYNSNSPIVATFHIKVCLTGNAAVKFFNKWMAGIPGSVDMTIEVRMIK